MILDGFSVDFKHHLLRFKGRVDFKIK